MASTLALDLAEKAGVGLIRVIYFRAPFFSHEERVAVQAQRWGSTARFQSITLKKAFLALDRHGGDGLFPCGFCRRLLLERAGRILRRLGADLLVTGEVVGRGGLGAEQLVEIDRELGLSGRVLRPLSARRLPPTWAEEAGYLDRSAFLGLAAGPEGEGGLAEAARAAGLENRGGGRRCLLADPGFVGRLRALGAPVGLTENHVRLLEFPHCYPLGAGALLVVALTAEEQVRLQPLFLPTDVRLYIQMSGSPLALLRAPWAALPPGERERVVRAAAERMAQAAGLSLGPGWEVRFRCEWEGETHRMRLPVEEPAVPTLIPS